MLIALIEIGIIKYAYEKIGINPRYVFALLLLSLLGSYVNIPVAELPAERVLSGEEIIFFGMRYVIPLVEEWPRTAPEVTVAPHADGSHVIEAARRSLARARYKLESHEP